MENIKECVVNNLKEQRGKLRLIADETGVPYPTLLKIGTGAIKNPGIDHIQVLLLYFRKKTCLDENVNSANAKRIDVDRRESRRNKFK
jgi:hypothetical protein